jgi:alpha-L-fucosidase
VDELLTNYGRVDEIWFDGNGAPPNVNAELYAHIKQLSPHTLIWTGPEIAAPGVDLRWVGNESGRAPVGETSVRTLAGKVIWYPSESDVSIRPSWFYHASEDGRVKSLAQLTDIFFNTVGRNSVLLLNVPPNRAGVLPPQDVARIGQFGASIVNLFTNNLAATKEARGDSTFQARDYGRQGG